MIDMMEEGEMWDEEESYFDEAGRQELEDLLQGNRRNMPCPVCNYLNPNGARFNGLTALIQHSKSKKSKDQAENLGHRQQATYLEGFTLEDKANHTSHNNKSRGTGDRNNRSSNNRVPEPRSDPCSSRDVPQPGPSAQELTVGRKQQRDTDMDVDDGRRNATKSQSKRQQTDKAFPEAKNKEVWPPLVVLRGILAVSKNDGVNWSPAEISNERLQDIFVKDLKISRKLMPKSAKLIYRSGGLALSPEADILSTEGGKKYGLVAAVAQLSTDQLSYITLDDLRDLAEDNNCGRKDWEEFVRGKWNPLCSTGDVNGIPAQNSMLFAYKAKPADVYELLPRDYHKFIVQKDVSRREINEVNLKLEEERRQKHATFRAMADFESKTSAIIQDKDTANRTLAQEIQEQRDLRQEQLMKLQQCEGLTERALAEKELVKQQLLQEQEQRKLNKDEFMRKISELQRDNHLMQDTHEITVGQLTTKLRCLQLDSKEDMQLRMDYRKLELSLEEQKRELENTQKLLELKEQEMEEKEVENKHQFIEITILERELKELKLSGEDEKGTEYQKKEAEINRRLKTIGVKFQMQDLLEWEMVCQTCQSPFAPYEPEPEWHKMSAYRFDIKARTEAKEKWRQETQNRFFVRFECGTGCSGFCYECANRMWEQAQKNAKREGKAIKKCVMCKQVWKNKPIPFQQNIYKI